MTEIEPFVYGTLGLRPWDFRRLTPWELRALITGRQEHDMIERKFYAGLTGLVLTALTGKTITADKIIPKESASEEPWHVDAGWQKIDKQAADKLLAVKPELPPGW